MPEEAKQEEQEGNTPDFTPLLQAYRELRERYPDFLISVKVGELYMLYGKDAEIAAPIINSRTLQMESDDGTSFAVTGFSGSWPILWELLLQRGYSTVIADPDGYGWYQVVSVTDRKGQREYFFRKR